MRVVLVAPYLGSTMRDCLKAFASLKEVTLGIISQQPQNAIPDTMMGRISGHYQIDNCLDSDQIRTATKAFIAEWGGVDRLIGYLEHLQMPLAKVRTDLNIDGMKAVAAANFRDKNLMKETLRQANLPVAKQKKITSAEDAIDFIADVGYPVVLKPLAGVGSKNTVRVESNASLYEALNGLCPSVENPIQAEAFVQGQEHTLETVCVDGKVIWQSATHYLPGPLTVIENPWMQYCVLLPNGRQSNAVRRFKKVNAKAMTALGMSTGLSHMEWFHTDAGPVISEVGARPPGVNIMPMLSIAHGVNMWDKWAELMVFDRWKMPRRKWAVGCAFLRAQGRGRRIVEITGLNEVLARLGDRVALTRLPQPGQARSNHYEGDGWVIVKHKTVDGVISAMGDLIQNIRLIAG